MDEFDELFRQNNDGCTFYLKYEDEYKRNVKSEAFTLPIAAAYNAGYDEAYKKFRRNELCHISQTKKD
jgi:hypothetical protein